MREDGLLELAAIKQDAKHFRYRMMVLERQKRATLAPIYRVAKTLLPSLGISQQNLNYYANLAHYYTITVVGTHALYAYEAAAGVHFGEVEAMATRDIDFLWDTRKRLSFVTQMASLGTTLLGLLRKVDPTFELRPNQPYTAVNNKGFEVDIIRREASEGDPHPLRVTDDEDEFFAVPAIRAGVLLNSPRFSGMIVSSSGHMARMHTVSPVAFAAFKRWLAERLDRDPMKRQRDILQAVLAEELVEEYLPHLLFRTGEQLQFGHHAPDFPSISSLGCRTSEGFTCQMFSGLHLVLWLGQRGICQQNHGQHAVQDRFQ